MVNTVFTQIQSMRMEISMDIHLMNRLPQDINQNQNQSLIGFKKLIGD